MCLVWVGVAPISINHFPCQFEFFRTAPISISDFRDSLSFSGSHLYQSAIFLTFPYQFEFFKTTPILISHFSWQIEFSGLHPYWSAIFLSFHVILSFSGLYLYRLIIFRVQFESGPHLYQSAIFLSFLCQFEFFGTAPISISHSSFCQFQLEFRGRTYIDRPFSYQFEFSLSQDRTHINRSFILPISSVWRPGSLFSITFRVTSSVLAFKAVVHTYPDILSHHCFSILGIQSHSLHLVTWCLLFAYHALLDFPFHYSWQSPLSSWHILRSCCWAPYNWHSYVVHIGQSHLGVVFSVL